VLNKGNKKKKSPFTQKIIYKTKINTKVPENAKKLKVAR
jgi:hypothetical protein